MSKKNRPLLSLKGDRNALAMEPTQQAQVETSVPIQEKNMEASQEKTTEVPPEAKVEAPAEVTEPTAKSMAAAEEANQARRLQLIQEQEKSLSQSEMAAVPIAEVASRGFEALQEARRRHLELTANKPVYVPPPRTERQMSRLEEELAAGARAVARSKAQQEAARPNKADPNKEGFTTPVYRPGDVVPDPVVGKTYKGFSPDV